MGYLFECSKCGLKRMNYLPCECIFSKVLGVLSRMVGYTILEYKVIKEHLGAGVVIRLGREGFEDRYMWTASFAMCCDEDVSDTIEEISYNDYKEYIEDTIKVEQANT